MKKITLLILLAAFTLVKPGEAQVNEPRSKLYFGVKGGFNISNVYDSQGETFDANAKPGVAFGGFLSIPIGPVLGIQPEILFSQRGFRGSGTLLGSNYKLTRTTTYLDVPLLVAIKPNKVLTILVGPQFSYILKQKDELASSSTSSQQEEVFKNDNIRKNTLSATAGFDINLHPVVLGFRTGFDLQNNIGDGTSTTPRYKNVWAQGTIGLRF